MGGVSIGPAVQVLDLQRVHLGADPQLQRLARVGGPRAAPLSAVSGLQRLRLSVAEPLPWDNTLKQLAALAPHARQLTSLTLCGPCLLQCQLAASRQLAELATSLRLLPELRELEVSQIFSSWRKLVRKCTIALATARAITPCIKPRHKVRQRPGMVNTGCIYV